MALTKVSRGLLGGSDTKNLIINGGFDVWQRGTSLSVPSGSSPSSNYLADRWTSDALDCAYTVSRQDFALGQTDVPNAKYYHRHSISTIDSTTGYLHFDQRIEDMRRFDGQEVVLSFWARASANTTLGFEFVSKYDSSPEDNGSTISSYNVGNMSLTTSWQKFTKTVTTTSLSGKTLGSGNRFALRYVPSTGSNLQPRWGGTTFVGDVDIAQVQLEYGQVPTPFEHRSYGEELALCQRYWQQSYDSGTPAGTAYGGSCYKGNNLILFDDTRGWTAAENKIVFPVELRTAPTVTWYGVNTGAVGKAGYTSCATTTDDLTIYGTTATSKGLSHYANGSGYPAGPWGANWTADAEL